MCRFILTFSLPVEFSFVGFGDIIDFNRCIERVFPEFLVECLVLEEFQSSCHCIGKSTSVVMLKSETTSLFSCLIEICNCISKTTCLHGNNRCASDKEFVLDNTTRFEFTWHEAEITTNIDQWTIFLLE